MNMNTVARRLLILVGFSLFASGLRAEVQVWTDGTVDKIWSTNAPNWAGGAVWSNGNSAVFSGAGGTAPGETVDVSATVTVANVTFQTNGYVIADANNDGALTLAGGASVISVVNAGDTGTVSTALGGASGFTKSGAGVLSLATNNGYYGTTTVSAGILRLSRGNLYALGQTGTGNDTVVASGATLDLNGAYVNTPPAERFTVSGSGTDGKGALINKGVDMTNRDLGWLTLLDNTTIGGPGRIDIAGCTGNNKTLTKSGTHQLCMKNVADVEIVINEGQYTLLADNRGLGGATPGNTTVNGGTLNAWNTMTVPERITFNGGNISQGNANLQLFTLSGYLTVNSNVNFTSGSITNGVEISGYVDGPGGFTQTTASWCYFTCDTNAYTGPTTINGGGILHVGRTNVYSGVLGLGVVTNNGNLFGLSSRIGQSNIVNAGNLYLCTGLLTRAGTVLNSGNLYIDRGGTVALANAFAGGGIMYVRSNATVLVSGGFSTNGQLRTGRGNFSLTNAALFRFTGELQIADRLNLNYAADPSNVTSIITGPAGCTLYAQAITFGNGTNVVNGGMTSVLDHAGTVITTGAAAEGNGIRLGHYPQAYSVYNLTAGTLTVGADYDLGCATDGSGWFNMTGGEVFAKRVMLNERDGGGGYGRLTVAGGRLNVGSLTGSTAALSNGICADVAAPYLFELGGLGGTIRAVTNVWIPATATLFGSNENAITFDTQAWTVTLTNTLSGAGGLNKAGSGTLALSGRNAYLGPTWVREGALLLGAANMLTNTAVTVAAGALVDLGGLAQKLLSVSGEGAVTNGSLQVGGSIAPGTNSVGKLTFALASAAPACVLAVDVQTNGTCDTVAFLGDLDLSGLTLQVVDPLQLNTHKAYTIATCAGTLSGSFAAHNLPRPWYVLYNRAGGTVQLRSENGTVIRLW